MWAVNNVCVKLKPLASCIAVVPHLQSSNLRGSKSGPEIDNNNTPPSLLIHNQILVTPKMKYCFLK